MAVSSPLLPDCVPKTDVDPVSAGNRVSFQLSEGSLVEVLEFAYNLRSLLTARSPFE